MKPSAEVWTLLQLTVFALGMGLSRGQKNGNNDGSVDYSSYVQSYGSNNYDGYQEPQDTGPKQILCYSCMFQVSAEGVAGYDTCIDPFDPTGIPTQKCNDGDCAKLYIRSGETRYTLTRACNPGCIEVEDENGYTQCCTGNLCNGATSAAPTRRQLITLTLTALFSIWTLLR